MLKRKLAVIILAVIVVNLASTPISALANELEKVVSVISQESEVGGVVQAKVNKFGLYGSDKLEGYNEIFKLDNKKIKKISNNGGNYSSSNITKSIDGNFKTHWETGKPNNSGFNNEVVIELDETTELNRIVYAARQDSAKGKGFAKSFEIYGTDSDNEDDYKLFANGSYEGSTADIVEIKFNPIKLKKIKFKFIEANNSWASAAEFMLYKEDVVSDKMSRLFTDATMSKVSEEFNTIDKINALDAEVKNHVLYENFKEELENAKSIIESKDVIYTNSKVSKFIDINSSLLPEYDKDYKLPASKITSITNNGGHYESSDIKKAIDGNANTNWHSGKKNTSNFTNEVVMNLDELTTLNRIVYTGARGRDRGFAEEFDIYTSKTSKGDNFELVSSGTAIRTQSSIEIKFNPTEFKRIKFVFKKGYENWAIASEFGLYKQDVLSEKVDRLFTDNTMSVLNEEFNRLEKINALDKEVENHPLYGEYESIIELARNVLENGNKIESTIWELESRGNSIKESQKRKLWNFQDWQPTGYRVKSGDIINVYVDVEEGKPAPEIVFKQMDSQHNGQVHIKLENGKNKIVIPELSSSELRPGTVKAGVLYTSNPYTPEEQGRKPKIRIEGADRYPHYIKGVDNDAEVMKELEDYVKLLKKDPSLTDTFDVFSDKTLVNVRATYALDWYKKNNKLPSYTANKSDEVIKETMRFWGFDGSSEANSDFNFRYASMLKWLDNGGFMNAGNGITGFNQREQGGALNVDTGWGFMHELGHNFDFNKASIGETTNNILPLHFEKLAGNSTKITEQNLWEGRILPKVALEDNTDKEYYPENDKSLLTHIAPMWQLQLYNENFWPQFEQTLRINGFKGGDWDVIHSEWVKVASDILKLDLYEHFARHGMKLTEETKEYTSKYSKPDKKLWYINDKIYLDNGGAFTENIDYSIESIKQEEENVKLTFNMDKENIKNTLGYEIIRDAEIVGFTAENKFIDKTATVGVNHEYKIVAYDKEINPNGEYVAKAFDPIIQSQDKITVGLNSNFNAKEYVIAKNYKGESIVGDVKVIKNTVDTSKKGIYEITYEITSEGTTKTSESTVEVISQVEYLSDIEEVSSKVGWRKLYKDKSSTGTKITLFKNGIKTNFKKGLGAHANSEVIYNIENRGFTTFKAYVGIDSEIVSNKSLATFEVYADDKKIYDSGKFKAGQESKVVDLDVTDVKELKLITTDAGNGNESDHTVWADAKLISNNSIPTINAEDSVYKLGDTIDLISGVSAKDIEDGDLTSSIIIKSSNFVENKLGNFKVIYEVKDSDGNIVEKTINVNVYDDLEVKKSQHGVIGDLTAYNELFKIPVSLVSNNGGNYGNSIIDKSIDGKLDSHFETGKPNSSSFKNEAIFTFDELTTIDKMAYAARSGGKGFATKFNIYASETIDGNDFYKVGEGSYNGSRNDVIEFDLNNIEARRIKFVFEEASENWASIGEMSFYSEDALANKISNELFIDAEQSDVTENYNSLEKLDKLREEVANHPANNIFESSLNKAEEIIRAKFPTLQIPSDISTKVGMKLTLSEEFVASDKEDGNITNKVQIIGVDKVNYNKPGTYEVIYTVEDSHGNVTSKVRNVHVVNMEDYIYLSDTAWKSTNNSYGKFEKDRAFSKNSLRLTGDDLNSVTYNKGLGTHSTATVIYDLTKVNAQYFTSFVGVDRAMYNTVGSVAFQVFLDGEKVYDSGVMKSKDKQKFVEVELSGAKELKLVMTDGGNGNGSDHGNWADAKLHYANEESIEINRSNLDALLKDIEALDKENYIEETWNNLMNVKESITASLSDGYNQKEIDTLYEELKVAKDSLQEMVKYDSLERLLEETKESVKELKEYLYIQNSWNDLLETIKQAESMVADKIATTEEVNLMIEKLTTSIDKLEVISEKVELEKLISFTDTITDISFVGASKHQQARWNNFVTNREIAKKILLKANATVDEVNLALFQLQYFIDELQMK